MQYSKKVIERWLRDGGMKDSYVDYLVYTYSAEWLTKRFRLTDEDLAEYDY